MYVENMKMPMYINRLDKIEQLSPKEREHLSRVTKIYAFRANEYYLSLINWNDPKDPIRRLVIPNKNELEVWGKLDASSELTYSPVSGLEHKYNDTVVLLVNDICAAYCRFCFRKRLFMDDNDEVSRDFKPALDYIRKHPQINNILVTGGDPLVLSTPKLEKIIRQLREIDHVRIIRIGSKVPAFNPARIVYDSSLAEMLGKYSDGVKKIYLMCHFNHPNELTDLAVRGIDIIQKSGIMTVNQTPMIRGVNDSAETLALLFNKLSYLGVSPYYLFQCRPTSGNKSYSVPIEEAYRIFDDARRIGSGLAKRARFVMSHGTGKIEIVGLTENYILFRYHRAADPANEGKMMIFSRNPEAYWFDDYREEVSDFGDEELITPEQMRL